jgi:hypothetical protein
MTFVGRVPGYVMRREENSNRSSFCLGTYQFKRPSATSDANSEFAPRLTIESGLSRYSNFHSLGVRLADYMALSKSENEAVLMRIFHLALQKVVSPQRCEQRPAVRPVGMKLDPSLTEPDQAHLIPKSSSSR